MRCGRETIVGDWRGRVLGMPAEFVRLIEVEREQWTTVARKIGFKRDR